MPFYAGFYPEHIATMMEALIFLKSQIKKYWIDKRLAVAEAHRDVIDKKIGNELGTIERAETFLEEKAGIIQHLDAKSHETLMDILRSALEIYLRDTIVAKTKSGLIEFDEKIKKIREITSLAGLKDGKTDLYDKYYEAPIPTVEGKRVEVFFSYSHHDRVLAGKIANLLTKRGIDVFLAHEDIEVSEEWREEIFEHLESCNVLLALLTPNFENSVWAIQEASYMHGKKVKVIPLIVGETDIKKLGFMEALQGIKLEEENFDDCVDEIFNIIMRPQVKEARSLAESVEFVEDVQAHLFFPAGTTEEHKNLNYHAKYLHHRLIVNLKTKPPEAYYMTPGSDGWKFIERYKNRWVSEIVASDTYSIDDRNFTKKWCDEQGYKLIPKIADKKDLLKDERSKD